MGIKNTLLKITSAIGVFFSVIFYVLFQLKKDENNKQKIEEQGNKINQLEAEKETIEKINKKQNEEKKKHEEKFNEAVSGLGTDAGFDAGVDLLQELRAEGRNRNSLYCS